MLRPFFFCGVETHSEGVETHFVFFSPFFGKALIVLVKNFPLYIQLRFIQQMCFISPFFCVEGCFLEETADPSQPFAHPTLATHVIKEGDGPVVPILQQIVAASAPEAKRGSVCR